MPPDIQQMQDIRGQIHQNASLTFPYLLMNALATIVACYGLLVDSTAVVIGAMVIAMLLGPITGIALGLVDGDNRLLRNAFLAELAGVLIVMLNASPKWRRSKSPDRWIRPGDFGCILKGG